MDDPVFSALADPTRRRLLDLLFERDGRTLGELVQAVPGMGRFGVMKHLRVLEGADLVTTRRVGREKHHYLNPVPVRRLHDRWLDKYRTRAAVMLLDLQRSAERMEESRLAATTTIAAPAAVSTIYIRATPDTIWRALTEPALTLRYHGAAFETDWRSGAAFRTVRDGKTDVEGEILEVDPPRRLVHTFRAHWSEATLADPVSRVTWEIDEVSPGVCRVTLLHDRLVEGSATARIVTSGGPKILSGLKTLLETGADLGLL